MKLKYMPKGRYTADATVLIPGETSDDVQECKFKVEFRRLTTTDEYSKLMEGLDQLREQPLAVQVRYKATALKANTLGWRDLPTEDGVAEFTPENLDELLQERCYVEGLYALFMEGQNYPQKAIAKNS